jgi:hypothetical protein
MQGLAKPAVSAILVTPIKKTRAAKPPEAVRRSGRIAEKTTKAGRMNAEEMA